MPLPTRSPAIVLAVALAGAAVTSVAGTAPAVPPPSTALQPAKPVAVVPAKPVSAVPAKPVASATATPVAIKPVAVATAKPAAPGAALEWVASFDDAVARARKEKKLILLDFYTDWCGWCKRLDRDVFADAGFQKAAAGVLGVKINAEKQRELAQRFQVSSFPRLFFLGSDGVIVERIRGYLSLQDFTAKVQAVKRGDTEFARYRDAANDGKNIGAVQAFARLLMEGSQHDQAIPYWQQVQDSSLEQVFRDPRQPGPLAMHREALVQLGDCYAAVGLFDVALQQYEEVLRTYPEAPEAVRAIGGMGTLRAKSKGIRLPVALLEQLVRSHAGSAVATQAGMLLRQDKVVVPTGGAQ